MQCFIIYTVLDCKVVKVSNTRRQSGTRKKYFARMWGRPEFVVALFWPNSVKFSYYYFILFFYF